MRRFLRFLLLRPIRWIIDQYTSAPDRARVFAALSKLMKTVETRPGKKGFALPFNYKTQHFIIFSDHHKGRKNGADDFRLAENNYLAALSYYDQHHFHLISLGDCEELWENTFHQVIRHNAPSFEAEKRFVTRGAFTKVFGNHDLDWDIDPLASAYLQKIYGTSMEVVEGLILESTVSGNKLRIFCTHGHQGDLQSDGNWFSKFFVSKIWAPLQAYLRINPNTPAYDRQLKTLHNRMMYDWAVQQQELILITGHTHQPVFGSLTHFERLQLEHRRALFEQNRQWAQALEDEMRWRSAEDTRVAEDYRNIRPVYFNAGCCCYADGDITGIELSGGYIRLVKWEEKEKKTKRTVLQESALEVLMKELGPDDDSAAG